jgi:hypothetical protein
MKKNLLFGLACFLSVGTVMATEVSSEKDIVLTGNEMYAYENPVTPADKKKKAAPSETERNFHITKCADDNKVFLMVGKKPNTKVRVRVYDKNGTLVYTESINAKRDFSTILNLEAVEGAVIRLTDSHGLEKDYTL